VRSILVVDDDADIVAAIQGALSDEGHAVRTATDVHEAINLIEQQPPDLLILDVTLPSMNSASVAARLRDLKGDAAPVLVITGDGRAAAKARTLRAYAYLRKPFDLGRLISTVERGLVQP